MKNERLAALIAAPGDTIRATVERINANSKGMVVVVDEAGRLVGTVTDGDIRRAVLAGMSLDTVLQKLFDGRAKTPYPEPVTAPAGTPHAELLHLMNKRSIPGVPLLDSEGCVADIVFLSDLMMEYETPLQAVIMAGGYGKRLLPLTENTPKPMLPVGDQPLMELMICQLRDAGIRRVNVTTHFEPEKIKDHFGDGARFGVDMHYVSEERPLGTAGALRLIEAGEQPLLIINGDILTKVDIRAMLAFHNEHKADLTVGVREYDFQVPYGVVETEDAKVVRVNEKPVYRFFVNAGIYLLQPALQQFIPSAERFDMTDLIEQLVAAGRTVVSFPIMEYWLDIGRLADYERAQQDVKSGEFNRS